MRERERVRAINNQHNQMSFSNSISKGNQLIMSREVKSNPQNTIQFQWKAKL
jgi:hypothetical protein